MKLRDYQIRSVQEIFDHFHKGNKAVILYAQTGAGKSQIAAYLANDCLKHNFPCVMIVRGRELVKNLSNRLNKYSVPHSVYMAGSNRYDPSKLIQICSVDTLNSRSRFPYADQECLVIIDECFTGDVEILTENGFTRFDEYNGKDKVAQVNELSKKMDFVQPLRVIRNDYKGKVFTFTSEKRIDVSTTPNHDMYIGSTSGYSKVKAKDVKTKQNYTVLTACAHDNSSRNITPFDRFQIAFQADGTHHYTDKKGLHSYAFSFSKERKIERFLKIARSCGYNIVESNEKKTEIPNRKDLRRFIIKSSDVYYKISRKYFGKISDIGYNLSTEIIEEMVHWDGSVLDEGRLYYYSSIIKDNVDFYQEISLMSGYHSNQIVQKDKRKDSYSDVYRLFITKNKNSATLGDVKKIESDYCGKIYCVEVPSGLIVVRRNGKIVVTGNCHRNYDPIYESYKSAFFLGLSGTPFNTSQNKNYNEVVCPIMGFELRDSGYLVPEITYVPHLVDTSDIKIVAGDFKRDQLEQLMSESAVVGNIVDDYIKYGEMRPAICFAVSIEHSKRLMDSFNKRGIRAIHCDASSTEEERTYAKFALENNKIDVLVNVDIFSVGFDCPIVSCIILARPTWSLIWYLQAVGRGLRSAPGKKNCIVLDNAGNIFRHGGPYKIREVDLYADPKARARRVLDESVKNCSNCFIIMLSVDLKCSHCGHAQEIKKKKLKEKSGELIIFNESPIEAKERKKRECKLHYQKLEWVRKQKKFHENWTFNNLEKKFDKETIWSLNSVARVPDRFSPKQGNVSSAFVENLRLV